MTSPEHGSGSGARGSLAIAAACYLLFVVYGSLVPVDYHPRPLDAAWRAFLGTRYLDLGVGSRADWVANILLYIPLAYLLCALFAGGARSVFGRLVGVVAVLVVCVAIALGVEFTQLFFPPRTVSLNDIIAEFIGTGLGIGIWIVWGGALRRLGAAIAGGGLPAIRTAVIVYVLAYLALSLFPYDFLVSAKEYSDKFARRRLRIPRRDGNVHAAVDLRRKIRRGDRRDRSVGRAARDGARPGGAACLHDRGAVRSRARSCDRDRATLHRVRNIRRRIAY